MLWKLLTSSMRKMWKDYIVLLFGLTVSIAIFYMFQTLAQNKSFLEANALITSIVFVFHVGTFILAMVTIFYIFYATSFILTLRQKELGMYMTLGAKKGKVTQMMFFETLLIGFISLIIGILAGIGLSQLTARMLMNQLNFSGEGFEAFYSSSLITTVIFYAILFMLTAFVNALKIASKSVLDLVRAPQQADPVMRKGWKIFAGTVISIILIGVGYYVMINMGTFLHFGVIAAAITITFGTYFFFMSLLPFIIRRLKSIRTLNDKGLNSFTFAQLQFRISQLTKVLGTVTMLVALGLGAMAASLSFYHNIEIQTSLMYANDVAVYQPTEEQLQEFKNWDFQEKNDYTYKVSDEGVYFLKDDLLNNPPFIQQFTGNMEELTRTVRVSDPLPLDEYSDTAETEERMISDDWATALRSELLATSRIFGDRTIYIVDETKFSAIDAEIETVTVGRLENFTEKSVALEKIDEHNQEVSLAYTGSIPDMTGSKYENYTSLKAIANGTIFMGLFLGIAFLMMMASVLMFKLLSSATADTSRYNMLRKIGVRRSKLSASIYKELFLIFLFPGLLGFVHVIVGMEMFSIILIEPYTKIWIPILLFLVIYLTYYLLTVQMYKRIVLPKKS
ncbi:putative ABC transport system permease protein [Gracilibacillus ureilyticus]|uniref:Putative ABC transport system permease protein n=1 Tax=Gracilibacillus ureilyticus TaxID=531814 RepID=A0A1H9QQ02_9BACI|nr:ABC transporter permease [Gracilibacillus ureilyticus]SER61813.1 putative ABC transport system permease protein [Gracilibacillus ureilyticus]